MIELPAVPVEIGPIGFSVTIPKYAIDAWTVLLESMRKNRNFNLYLKIDRPKRPKSTGKRSINSRIHGHCSDIAIQLSVGGKEYSMDDVKSAMKRMAVELGYRTYFNDIDGVEEPLPLKYASMEDASKITKMINLFADKHGFWLTEYDEDGKPYKSIEGRKKGGGDE